MLDLILFLRHGRENRQYFREKHINKRRETEINMREFHGSKSEGVEKQPGAARLCAASAAPLGFNLVSLHLLLLLDPFFW